MTKRGLWSHSLRSRLLWFLLTAICVTAGIQATVTYRTAQTEADDLFDYHLQQMALALRSGVLIRSPESGNEGASGEENVDFFVQVWTAEGLRIFQSAASSVLPQRTVLGFSDIKARGTTYRVFSLRSRTQLIQVAQDRAVRQDRASALALKSVLPILLAAPLLMIVSGWIVSSSLVPVARVQHQIAARQAHDLTAVSERGLPDEIKPLVQELNLLLKRLGQAFETQRNFVADAAHELRSPLAALRLQAHVLQQATDDRARQGAMKRLDMGIERATRLVEQLLILARQQAHAVTGSEAKPVSLAHITRLAIADLASVAQARQIDLGLIQADEGQLWGHPEALRILTANLLDNAIKYAPIQGIVDVAVRSDANYLMLDIQDNGPGIPEQDRARVFDRFYRVAEVGGSGSGLGLAIVKAITEWHGAIIHLDRSERLGGLQIAIRFPALPNDQAALS